MRVHPRFLSTRNIMRSSLYISAILLATFTNSAVARPGLGSLFFFGKTASAVSKSSHISNNSEIITHIPAPRDPRALSVAQIKNCIVSEKKQSDSDISLNASAEFIHRKKRELSQTEERVKGLSAQIDSLKPIATYDELAVNRFNEKVEAFNSSLRFYTAATDTFEQEQRMHNAKVKIHNDSLSTFNFNCAGKPYYSEDMDVAMKELRSHPQN